MQEISVTLETVTPLFLGGANQEPEIRAPAFRGLMRYWLRALAGAHYGNNLQEIKKIEESVFGSTERGSAVALRVREITRAKPIFLDPPPDSGKGYLLWTAKSSGRNAFPAASTKIQLDLLCKANGIYACAALWLLINLGGLGTRSRRGLGSLTATKVENWSLEYPPLSFEGSDYTKFLMDGISTWQNLLGLLPSTSAQALPRFDCLHPSYCGVYVGKAKWSDWDSALEGLGNLLKEFRGSEPPDHDGVLSVIKGTGQPQTVERAIFGLPMQFFYRSYHNTIMGKHPELGKSDARKYATAMVTPSTRNSTEKPERRGSPIHFKFARLNPKSLILVATFFESEFLPQDYKLRIAPGGKDPNLKKRPAFVNQPGYGLLESFFSQETWQSAFGGQFRKRP